MICQDFCRLHGEGAGFAGVGADKLRKYCIDRARAGRVLTWIGSRRAQDNRSKSNTVITLSQFDIATLPAPIAAYFAAKDHAATTHLFAPNAVVRDESETHSGAVQIANWLASVEARYHPRYVVQTAETTEGRTLVSFTVSGTFPGSPATLRQAFTVANEQIQTLETL